MYSLSISLHVVSIERNLPSTKLVGNAAHCCYMIFQFTSLALTKNNCFADFQTPKMSNTVHPSRNVSSVE